MIRKGILTDFPAVCALYDAVIENEKRGGLTGWQKDVYPTPQTVRDGLDRDDLYVYEDCGVIKAAAFLNYIQVACYKGAPWNHQTDGDVPVMHTLAVHPLYHRHGIGGDMVSFYESWAKKCGFHELRIDTNAVNLPARAMYRKRGYKEIAVVPTNFNGIFMDLVLLEKYLDFSDIRCLP